MDNFTKARLTKDLSTFKETEMGIYAEAQYGYRFIRLDDLLDGRFFLSEEFPVPRSKEESIDYLQQFQSDPNGYQAFLNKHAPGESIVNKRMSYGMGVTLYHATIESALECLIEAIDTNRPITEPALVDKYRKKQPEWLQSYGRNSSLAASVDFLEQCRLDEDLLPPSLFDDKYTLFGDPISRDVRVKILSYINAPTLELWMTIRSLPITPMATLWQMLTLAHPEHPFASLEALRSGIELSEADIPSGEMVKRLLKRGVELNNKQIDRRIEKLQRQIAAEAARSDYS